MLADFRSWICSEDGAQGRLAGKPIYLRGPGVVPRKNVHLHGPDVVPTPQRGIRLTNVANAIIVKVPDTFCLHAGGQIWAARLGRPARVIKRANKARDVCRQQGHECDADVQTTLPKKPPKNRKRNP